MSNKFCKLVISRSLAKDLNVIFSDEELRETLTNIALKQIVLVVGVASSDNEAVKIINRLQPTIQIMRSTQSSLAQDYYFGIVDYCLAILDYRNSGKPRNSLQVMKSHKDMGKYTKVFKLNDNGLVRE